MAEQENSTVPRPAMLARRMATAPSSETVVLSRKAADPIVRCSVEANCGKIVARLEGDLTSGTRIQWFRNGEIIRGQTFSALHLAKLEPDDSDVFYAQIATEVGTTCSQSLLVVVLPGNVIMNFSARALLTPTSPIVVGFVIGGRTHANQKKTYLIRAISGSLRRFGIVNTHPRPTVSIAHRGGGAVENRPLCSNALDPQIQKWSQKVGAFALSSEHDDFASAESLGAGVYTITVRGDEQSTGEVLVEVYETTE